MDISDRPRAGRGEGKAARNERDVAREIGPDIGQKITGAGAVSPADSPAVDSPACSLEFHATLFGSTLAKVFSALDGVALGQQVAITTNDP